MSLPARLKLIRTDKNFTLEKFASMLDTSKQVLSNYENGKSSPTFDLLFKIIKIFGVSPVWLMLGIGEMYSQPEPTNKLIKNEQKLQNFKNWGSRFCNILSNINVTPHAFSKVSGIRESRINKFILDSIPPTIQELNAIAVNLDISIDELLYGKNTPVRSSEELTPTEVLELKNLLKNLKK